MCDVSEGFTPRELYTRGVAAAVYDVTLSTCGSSCHCLERVKGTVKFAEAAGRRRRVNRLERLPGGALGRGRAEEDDRITEVRERSKSGAARRERRRGNRFLSERPLAAAEADAERRAASRDGLDLPDSSLGSHYQAETERNVRETTSAEMTVILIPDNKDGFLCSSLWKRK